MLPHVGCLKEVQGNADIDLETTSCVYGVRVKCSTYGFRPAECVRNLHLS